MAALLGPQRPRYLPAGALPVSLPAIEDERFGPAETALPTCRSIAGIAAWPSRMNDCELSWRRTLNKAEEVRGLAFSGFLQHLVP